MNIFSTVNIVSIAVLQYVEFYMEHAVPLLLPKLANAVNRT